MLYLPQFQGTIRHKLEMRRKGKEVGRDNSPTSVYLQQQKTAAAMGKQKRKLVILPAKPPPRKSKSVLAGENGKQLRVDESDYLTQLAQHRRNNSKKADAGVFDELKRLGQMNQTWYGNKQMSERTGASSTNTKALKNMSKEVHTLIEHRPMQYYVDKMANAD